MNSARANWTLPDPPTPATVELTFADLEKIKTHQVIVIEPAPSAINILEVSRAIQQALGCQLDWQVYVEVETFVVSFYAWVQTRTRRFSTAHYHVDLHFDDHERWPRRILEQLRHDIQNFEEQYFAVDQGERDSFLPLAPTPQSP